MQISIICTKQKRKHTTNASKFLLFESEIIIFICSVRLYEVFNLSLNGENWLSTPFIFFNQSILAYRLYIVRVGLRIKASLEQTTNGSINESSKLCQLQLKMKQYIKIKLASAGNLRVKGAVFRIMFGIL